MADTEEVFVEGDWRYNAFFRDWYGRDTTYFMAEAYWNCANLVVSERHKTSTHGDTAFWPAAFLYRHAIELYLKEIISIASALNKCQCPHRGHKLEGLLGDAEKQVSDLFSPEVADGLKHARTAVEAIHSVDPQGDAFRYRESTNKVVHLTTLPESVDILTFAHAMDRGLHCLAGNLIMVQDRRHQMEEYQADMNELNEFYRE